MHVNSQELVIFHGEKIGTADYTISTSDMDAGVSAKIDGSGNVFGKFFSPAAATVVFLWANTPPENLSVYINSIKQSVTIKSNSITISFPAGEHSWQITKGLPVPARSEILYSVNNREKVDLFFAQAAGSEKFRIETSIDQCETWKVLAETVKPAYTVSPVPGLDKIHVRVTAINKEHEGAASAAYPVYFTKDKPAFPDGLRSELHSNGPVLTWGQVLGCHTYKLYRRKKGTEKYELIYIGKDNVFQDNIKSLKGIYQYAIAAINGNGESTLSGTVDTDPASWLHRDPKPGEKFRRTNTTFGYGQNKLYYPD